MRRLHVLADMSKRIYSPILRAFSRIDTGIPGYNGLQHMGCYPYWNGQDLWGVRNGAAINALYFSGAGKERQLHVPSVDVVLRRV